MAKHDSKSIRNIAIVGHGGTGKTSIAESMLFVSGKTDRLGRPDDGTSIMDWEPEEQKRRISISAAVAFVEWDKHRINILDTPGDANFAMDTRSCLRVADGAVVVVDAVGGVEFQTEKVWETSDEYSLPRLIFINRMDRERANFEGAIEGVKKIFGKKATPLFIPIGAEDKLKGIIDLMQMKALFFDDPKGKVKAGDIPAELAEEAKKYRETMTEDIAECDEALMDKYLESGELTPEELKTGLRKGVISGSLFPVVCGVANRNIGIAPLMDLIAAAMPSPLDRGDAEGKNPSTGAAEKRSPDEKAPFSAYVFKTISDPFAGRLTLFKVYSGTASSDGNFFNPTRKTTERFGNIFYLDGKSQKPAESVVPGDIAAVAKLKETFTGDTMTEEKNPIQYEKVQPIPAIISFAVQPKSKGDEEKIMSGLNRLVEEDPTLNYRRDEQTREIILSGMGQVHIEIAIEKMKRKFGVEVTLNDPQGSLQGNPQRQDDGPGPLQETVRRPGPVRRHVARDRAPAQRRRVRVRRQDRRRIDPQELHPRRREGNCRGHGGRCSRRLPRCGREGCPL